MKGILKALLVLSFTFIVLSHATAQSGDQKSNKLRIGWQTTWATQGQLVQILQKTPILKNAGIDAEFVGFAYGAPLNQAALAGDVDVVLTADQPAITLISKDPDWEIIGRLMYNSGALMVRPESPYKRVADLKGKTVAVPFVAAVHRVLIDLEIKAGLVPDKDIKNINLGINEIQNLALSGKESGWGTVDAMSVWDPTPFILEGKGLVRTIARCDIIALIVMNKSLRSDPKVGELLLKAFKEAYWYYRQHQDEANKWFAEAARLDYDLEVLNKAASFEPNLRATTKDEIRLELNESDMNSLKNVSKFLFERKLIDKVVDLDTAVNQRYLKLIDAK